MDTVTISMSREEAAEFLKNKRAKVAAELAAQIEKIDAEIAKVVAPEKGKVLADSDEVSEANLSRTGKGEAKARTLDYLRGRLGHGGVTIKKIAEDTGSSYTAAYRVLMRLKEDGTVTELNRLWSYVG